MRRVSIPPCGATVFTTGAVSRMDDIEFPYALWRDGVCNRPLLGWHGSWALQAFPYALWRDGVCNLDLGVLDLARLAWFPYALWRDGVCNTGSITRYRVTGTGFPYALWRDGVCNPTPVGGAVTSADAVRLQGPPSKRPQEEAEMPRRGCLGW